MGARHTDRDLFHQWEEAEARAEKWEKKTKEEKENRKREVSDIVGKFQAEMAEMRGELKGEIGRLENRVGELEAENEALKEDNERLKSIINKNSNNSSKPPSSDEKPSSKKANEYNGREKSGKKRGGQLGHQGKSLTKKDAEELIRSGKAEHEIVEVNKPRKACGKYISKYEYDIVTRTVVREYRYYADKQGKYHIPKEHRTDVFYGTNLKTMAVALYNIGVMSNERIKEMLNAMSGNVLHLSDGAVYQFIRQFSEKIEPTLEAIKTDLLNQKVLYTDATVVTVNGVQNYIRNVSSSNSVLYYGMDKKALKCLDKIPALKKFRGVLVHDHETTLYHFGTDHAECNVHLLRYLTKNCEDTKHSWSEGMKRLLSEMNKERKKLIEEGKNCFPDAQLASYKARYADLIALGRQQNQSAKPKWAKDDERKLLNRMEKYQKNHLLFLHRFDVPVDNNLSERDLRKCKNRQKISGGFGLSDGRDMACKILSFFETCKRRSLDLFRAVNSVWACAGNLLGE